MSARELRRPWHLGDGPDRQVRVWADSGLNAMGSRSLVGVVADREIAEYIVTTHNANLTAETPTNPELWK